MTRRHSKTTRRLILSAGLTASALTAAYTSDPELSAGAAIGTWILIGIGYVLLRRKPRHRKPRATVQSPLEHEQTALYKAYNHTQQLIYVGICATHQDRNIIDRINEHFDQQPWWQHEVAHITVADYYPTRALALAAEARAIHDATTGGAQLRNRTHVNHELDACPTLRASPLGAAP